MPVINLGGDGGAPDDPSNNGQWIQYPDGTWGPPGGGFGPYGGRSTPYAPPTPQPTPTPTYGTTIHTTTPGGFDLGSLLGISSAQAAEAPPPSSNNPNDYHYWLGAKDYNFNTWPDKGGAPPSTAPAPPRRPITPTPAPANNFWNPRSPGVTATDLAQGVQKLFPHLKLPPGASTWGQQVSDAGAIEGGNPAVALPVSSGQNPAPTLPQPDRPFRGQVPLPPVRPRPTPMGALAAPQAAPQAAPYQQGTSPFTMVLRPNAPAGQAGGRGGGGPDLTTALDLSNWGRGYQPPPPPAPRNVNLGYGAPPVAPAARPVAAPVQQGYNPFTHVWRDPNPQRVGTPIGGWWNGAPGARGIVQGPRGTELLNPGGW